MTLQAWNEISELDNLFYLLGEKNYRNGFPYFNPNYRKRRKLFNPLISNTFMALIIIRDFISLFITEDFYSILIGDWIYKFEYKLQLNLTIFNFYFMVVLIQILNHMKLKNNKNFQQILNTRFNPNLPSVKKMKYFIKFVEILFTYFILFLGFSISIESEPFSRKMGYTQTITKLLEFPEI